MDKQIDGCRSIDGQMERLIDRYKERWINIQIDNFELVYDKGKYKQRYMDKQFNTQIDNFELVSDKVKYEVLKQQIDG